jgi:hypothetical protein
MTLDRQLIVCGHRVARDAAALVLPSHFTGQTSNGLANAQLKMETP